MPEGGRIQPSRMGVKPITAEELSMQSEPRPLTPQKATDCSAACTHRVVHRRKKFAPHARTERWRDGCTVEGMICSAKSDPLASR